MQRVYLGSEPREKVGAVGMGVIWSSVIDLVITVGSQSMLAPAGTFGEDI